MRNREFEQLYKRRFGLIVNLFSRRGYSRPDCKDLSQETFLRVFKHMERVRNPEAYLLTAAGNVWKNDLRSRGALKRQATLLPLEGSPDAEGQTHEHLPPDGNPGALEQVEGVELQELLRTAIQRLPSRMRYCLLLRAQPMSYEQIAQVMQISKGTVKSQLHQARQRLSQELGDRYDWNKIDGGSSS